MSPVKIFLRNFVFKIWEKTLNFGVIFFLLKVEFFQSFQGLKS